MLKNMNQFCPYCQIEIDVTQVKNRRCNNCDHKWEVYHVLPLNDTKQHRESQNCQCFPQIKIEAGNIIVVHSSFDGREGVEWANEILSTR